MKSQLCFTDFWYLFCDKSDVSAFGEHCTPRFHDSHLAYQLLAGNSLRNLILAFLAFGSSFPNLSDAHSLIFARKVKLGRLSSGVST